jgi:3-methyladenine DNA glycosylase AlkD
MRAATRRVVDEIRAVADPSRKPGMARVGINVEHALGVNIPSCRAIAKRHRHDHELALGLWATGIHEGRIVASMVDDPTAVTRAQMEEWVSAFDSWDLCDQVCGNLFIRTPHAVRGARAWVHRDEEYAKRAGFTMVAELAHRDRTIDDDGWERWFAEIRRAATDERNYVKKAVNWALRQIGKRNETLRRAAIAEAEALLELDSRSARWIARDALRELRSDAVRQRVKA